MIQVSKYTTELRYICEELAGYAESQDYSKIADIIETARPLLFDFSYPIYDKDYKSVLETKIIKHFYTREIGAETYGRWKLFLDVKMNLIMPYYNKLYQSELLEFNPLYNVDLTTDHQKDNGGNGESQQNTTTSTSTDRTYNRTDEYTRNLTQTDDYTRNLTDSTEQTSADTQNQWNLNSDTPQGGIEGLESNNYLTSAQHNTGDNSTSASMTGTETGTTQTETTQAGSDSREINDTDNTNAKAIGNTNGTTKYTDTESYLEHVKGKTAGESYSKLLTEYRETFINIDNMIMQELEPLFLQLW